MKEPDYCLEYLDKHWTLSKKSEGKIVVVHTVSP